MSNPPLRVLFCIGINQNFFDLPAGGGGAVWKAFVAMMEGIKATDGVDFIGDMDDDSHMVGPSAGYPWTSYILADVDSVDTVRACCNLFRTTPVGDGEFMLWKYATVEARIGRALTVRDDVHLPD